MSQSHDARLADWSNDASYFTNFDQKLFSFVSHRRHKEK